MSYQNYEGSMEELICQKLREIEEKEKIRVLHAVESGSRAWGFASPDSDYDVRFIYMRPLEYYLGLQKKKDYLDWELNETLDINGWDLTKALQHFHKSNAVMFEWANSPVVYRSTPEWEEIKEAAGHYFSARSAMYHYYGTAKKNYIEYFDGDFVKYKKYFYVLRPILACKWIEEKKCPPPVRFLELSEQVLEEGMKPSVERLMQKKMRMIESETGERVSEIDAYISKQLVCFEEKLADMPEDRNADWEELNHLFLRLLGIGGRERSGI